MEKYPAYDPLRLFFVFFHAFFGQICQKVHLFLVFFRFSAFFF